MWKKYLKQLSLPESYISITLGFLVVIVAGLLIYNYATKNKQTESGSKEEISTQVSETEEINKDLPASHTVQAKETLWSIAVKYYNSGYNWVSIAKENKLINPDSIKVGQTLNIPKAEVIQPVKGKISATTSEIKTYTVLKGDSLWKIAVKEYGNGYQWSKIAQENKLPNPDVIYPGSVLRLIK